MHSGTGEQPARAMRPDGLRWRDRLSTRLAFIVLGAALLVGVLLAAIQLILDLQRLRGEVDATARQALAVMSEPAVEAAYNIDPPLAHQVISGLMGFPGVHAARLQLSTGERLSTASTPLIESAWRGLTDDLLDRERSYQTPLKNKGSGEILGSLELQIDTFVVGRPFLARALVVAALEIVRTVLLALALLWLYYRFLTRPLLETARALTSFDPEAPEQTALTVPPGHLHDEFGAWVVSVNRLLATIRDHFTRRSAAEARASFLAHFDELTSLPNRRLFQIRLGHALAAALSRSEQVAVLHLDLIEFREVNQQVGIEGGDEALREIGRRLSRIAGEDGFVCRLAEDSFGILCVSRTIRSTAEAFCLAALDAVGAPLQIGDRALRLRCAIGIALHPDDGASADALLQNAERALLQAKVQGNSQRFYVAQVDEEQKTRKRLERDLAAADWKRDFFVHYQPVVSALNEEAVGFEALVRWHHPELGLLSPARFIPIAESNGTISALGRYVLIAACAQMRAWQMQMGPGPRMAVNVSGVQLRDPRLDETISRLLRDVGLNPEQLEIEITETAVVENFEQAAAMLERIRNLGVQIAIDDFGTGHASLNYLKRLPIDKLKIDQSFVRDLLRDPGDEQIVRAIINLGHSLNLKIVAEGVEEAAQATRLREFGCDMLQGFHYARPMAAEEAGAWLVRRSRSPISLVRSVPGSA